MPRRIRFHFRRNAYRIPFYLLTPIALFLILRFSWGWESAHQLNILKQQLTAKGFNFSPAPPPSGPNPAEALFATAGKLPLTSADFDLTIGDDPGAEIPIWNARKPQMRALLARVKPFLDEVEADTRLPGEPAYALPVSMPSNLGRVRATSELLRDDALFLIDDHQVAPALHRLREILEIARLVDSGNHIAIAHLVATSERARAAHAIEFLQPRLELEMASLPEADALLVELADLGPFERNEVLALRGEANEISEDLPELMPELASWFFEPLKNDATRLNFRGLDELADAAAAPNWPAIDSRLRIIPLLDPSAVVPATSLEDFPFRYAEFEFGERFVHLHFRAQCDSSAAAMLLAAQMYKPLHGHYPQTAKEMVPSLLRFVPIDPFAPGRTPMHYRLDPAGPTVWSVGENGTDEHGIVQFDSAGKKLRRYDGNSTYPGQPDIIYGAAWRTAQPPPATH